MRLLRLLAALVVAAVLTAAGVAGATHAGLQAAPTVDPLDAVEPVLARLTDAPPLPEMAERAPERSVVLAANGSVLSYLVGAENRVRLPEDKIPVVFVDALLAAEDDRFYDHRGVDLMGIARAFVRNAEAGEIKQGGSTITQQLVENTILPNARSYREKVQEAWYAVQLEQQLSKDQILTRYLNRVYFGQGAYGIAAAAERYFSTTVDELRVDQVALLIGLVRAPSALNPIDNPNGARQVRNVVLDSMAETGRLGASAAAQARRQPLDLDPKAPPKPRFPFFAEYVRDQLLTSPEFDDVLGTDREQRETLVYGGGLTIHTTLKPKRQRAANKAIRKVMKGKRAPQAALVMVQPGSGNVQAMAVGPRKFGECERRNKRRCAKTMVNPAVLGLGGSGRQPGSAFKPFVAAAALKDGIPRGWEMETQGGKRIPGCRDGDKAYKPHNYSPDPGSKDMTEAMRVSSNVYFAKLAGEVGPRRVVKTAKSLGLAEANLPEGCAVALGAGAVTPLQMATSYATFAANGRHCDARAVVRIEMAGETHKFGKRCERAVPKRIAKKVTTLLREPVRAGTATAVRIGRPVAGKTGTTQDYRDAWFVGYVRQLATAAWVGHEQPAPMVDVLGRAHVTGGSVPAELWTVAMKRALRGVEKRPLPSLSVDRVRVPVLKGQRLAAARKDAGYELKLDVVRVDHHRPRGTIVRQSPKPGTRVAAGSTVVVRVSNGLAPPPRRKRPTDKDEVKQSKNKKKDSDEATDAEDGGENDQGSAKEAAATREQEESPEPKAPNRDAEPAQRERDSNPESDPEPEPQPSEREPEPQPSEREPEPQPSEGEPEPEPTEAEPEPSEPEPEPSEPEPEPEPTEPEPQPSEPEPEPEPTEAEPEPTEPEPQPSEPENEPEPEPTEESTEPAVED